jgi:hypothetical protein
MADNGVTRAKLKDLIPDARNANLHSERGTWMVNKSIAKLGAGRSILIDKNNQIIAGNLTTEQAADIGIEDVVIVDTDGTTLVAVRRTDMDLDDPDSGAREMAYADNRAAVVSIDFDPEQIALDLDAGLDLGDWFFDWEVDGILENMPTDDEWGDAFSKIPDSDRAPFQQMTFTLHDDQAEQVREALKLAKAAGEFVDSHNENSNGNALARIVETYITDYGKG